MLEIYQVGFGEQCYIYDEFIKPINQLIRGEQNYIPTAIRRLPQYVKDTYVPALNSPNLTVFEHAFVEVGDCNKDCKPIPYFQRYNDTQNGRRQLVALSYDLGVDLGPLIQYSEPLYIEVINDLNRLGYCSPYVLCN